MDPSNFSSDAPGRLVPTLDGRHLAFVPDPLPPTIDLGAASQRLLADAADAVGELRGMARMLPHPGLVTRPFARQEAVLSSRIEGTTADIEDLVLYQAAPPPNATRLDDDVAEVANYQAALDLGLALLGEMPFCNRLIREVHGRLLRGVRGQERRPGEFRQIQNAIGTLGTGTEHVRFMPPPVHEMLVAMDDLERYIGLRQDSTPLLVQLALIHYQFETIHPFMDGNGRVGRLIIPLLLHERGQLRHPLLYLSAFFDRHRDEYKDRLLAVSQHGAWEAWIAFFLQGVLRQATAAVSASDRLLALREDYRSLVSGPRTSASDLLLVDFLFESPAVTARTVAERIGVTPRAAYGLIQRFVERGILVEATGRSYKQVFLAGEIVALTDRDPHIDSHVQSGSGKDANNRSVN